MSLQHIYISIRLCVYVVSGRKGNQLRVKAEQQATERVHAMFGV